MTPTRPSPPWITPRSTERNEHGAFAYDGQRIFYPGLEEDRMFGALWQPMTTDPDGETMWKEMHTFRQRACMLDRLCQVCGQAIEGVSTPWLLPALERRVPKGGKPFLTSTPPLCEGCVPRALRQCPNLSQFPPLLLTVSRYRTWGVWGDTVVAGGRLVQGQQPVTSPLLPATMARHLVVEVFDYRRARQQPNGS